MGGFAWRSSRGGPCGEDQVRQDQKGHTKPGEKLVQRNGMKEIISGSHGGRRVEGHQLEGVGRGQLQEVCQPGIDTQSLDILLEEMRSH